MANLSKFLRAAAKAYRGTGLPEAADVAARIEAHAMAPFSAPRGTPACIQHLATAVGVPDAHSVVPALGPAINDLPWTAGFLDNYCFATLIGPGTPIPDAGLYFGLYLQAPDSFYPSHCHIPEELYFILSGRSDWQKGDAAFEQKAPGDLIHHRPNEPHAMRTGAEPVLAMWTWSGDLSGDIGGKSTYRFV